LNLYAFVNNDGVNNWDYLGKTDMSLRTASVDISVLHSEESAYAFSLGIGKNMGLTFNGKGATVNLGVSLGMSGPVIALRYILIKEKDRNGCPCPKKPKNARTI
jgi:hypothetical protein